jgi:hypothetical protein
MKEPGSETDAALEFAIAAERQRCIDRVLTYAALRDRAAVLWMKLRPGPARTGQAKGRRNARECKRRWRATLPAIWPRSHSSRRRRSSALLCE